MGRKKVEEHKRKDKVFKFRLSNEQLKRLEILEESTGESRAELLRYGLDLVWERIFDT